jgi:cytochrome c biogenesis protein CcdA
MLDQTTELPLLIGGLASIIHVLSGPDHLAAVAPFAVNEENSSWRIGLFWGVGHTLGLGLIGILFYFFGSLIPVEFISSQSERIVGVVLIIIGVWVFFKLIKNHSSNKKTLPYSYP